MRVFGITSMLTAAVKSGLNRLTVLGFGNDLPPDGFTCTSAYLRPLGGLDEWEPVTLLESYT
jgi:hypothetical protein